MGNSLPAGAKTMAEAKSKIKVSDEQGVQMVEFTDRKILDELTITQIGEDLAAKPSRQHLREIENPHSFQRQHPFFLFNVIE